MKDFRDFAIGVAALACAFFFGTAGYILWLIPIPMV